MGEAGARRIRGRGRGLSGLGGGQGGETRSSHLLLVQPLQVLQAPLQRAGGALHGVQGGAMGLPLYPHRVDSLGLGGGTGLQGSRKGGHSLEEVKGETLQQQQHEEGEAVGEEEGGVVWPGGSRRHLGLSPGW